MQAESYQTMAFTTLLTRSTSKLQCKQRKSCPQQVYHTRELQTAISTAIAPLPQRISLSTFDFNRQTISSNQEIVKLATSK